MRFQKLAFLTLSLLLPSALLAQVSGWVSMGGHGAQEKDNPARAAEFSSTTSGPDAALALRALFANFYLDVQSWAQATDRQEHALTFELGRLVRSHTTFSKLPHRLVHDSLANLAGAVSDVKIVYATDLDPWAQYGIRYDRFANTTTFQLPQAPWLTLQTDVQEQWRRGHVQSLSVSHCYSCHVVSQDKSVNQHTKDAAVTLRASARSWLVEASAASRDFREREAAPLRLYELAQHPNLRTPLFNDRVIFDERSGPLPYGVLPRQEKDSYKFSLSNPDFLGFSLALSYVSSDLANENTGNKVSYDGASLTLSRRLKQNTNFSLFLRSYQFDSTDYFFDSPEPVAVAGPYAGKTYRQRYGFDPDYLRQSALDREVKEGTLRLSHRVSPLLTLSAQYQARSIDRTNYQVAPGETTTLEQKAKLNLLLRPTQKLRLRATLGYADISHPFMALNAACNPDPLQTTPAPSPLAPGSVQYYQIHDARVADLTASPSSYKEARLTASYQATPSTLATLSYQWWDGDNQDLDLTNWSKNLHAVTASLTTNPSESWAFYAAASYSKRELETFVCIPLMDG
jgi:hypothetical protein